MPLNTKTKLTSTSALIERHFTDGHRPVFEMVDWHKTDASILAADGSVVFHQKDVEFPTAWSQTAVNIVAEKYFRRPLKSQDNTELHAETENSLKQMINRVVGQILDWSTQSGHFTKKGEAEIFGEELTYLLVTQRASFNSPVWFNIGVRGVPQQSSACFILSVEDSLNSILNWVQEEGIIFKGGSGAGVNLSNIRSSKEGLSGGGQASGPVSFMRGADASAGAIRSGGTTRRAAKMVILDGDHPDISDFIWCKAREERKARALRDSGFDLGVDGKDLHSLQYQNANNSIRLTEEFFEAVKQNNDWELRSRTTGEVLERVSAREMLDQIAEAVWECADPGVQYDTTINKWHTTPKAGRISGSNPCSEYFHLDDSACNLSSLNLVKFLDESGRFQAEDFKQAVRIMIIAQDILAGGSDYPTEKIGKTARAYRQLGLGYANLGALVMSMGFGYDSAKARAAAASVTALMTGEAYLASAEMAERLGAFDGYSQDSQDVLRVLSDHRAALNDIDSDLAPNGVMGEAESVWDQTLKTAQRHGVRNSQVSVLAPTGTISFMMDCDTTGIEPDLALVKTKQMVGGGTMVILNHSCEMALRALGYPDSQISEILDHIYETGSTALAPGLNPEHQSVFACAIGENPIEAEGHILMMAAVQPFISGGISKTVNISENTTPKEISDLLCRASDLGIKALAIYRDNSKVGQPLLAGKADSSSELSSEAAAPPREPIRKRLPKSRDSKTFEFQMGSCKGYVTVGEYEDGRPGEIFVRMSKQGSTLSGVMDAFAIAISQGLQHGVPLYSFVKAFTGMRFEPVGVTDDPELRMSSSIIDYIFKRLALQYLSLEERSRLNIHSVEERKQLSLPGLPADSKVKQNQAAAGSAYITGSSSENKPDASNPTEHREVNLTNGGQKSGSKNTNKNGRKVFQAGTSDAAEPPAFIDSNAPLCVSCGFQMIRSGTCYVCSSCGSTSGCS